LAGQLMSGLIPMPVPPLQVQLPGTRPMSMGQALSAANAVAAGQAPVLTGPLTAGAQRQ
jgi:hypothetical protein